RFRPNRRARRSHDRFIQLVVAPPKRPPTNLEGAKTFRLNRAQMIGERLGFLHEQGSVRADAVAVPAAQQSAHRLARRLAQQIPKRDVNAADRMRDRPATALPESVLVQLLADTFGFQRAFAEE